MPRTLAPVTDEQKGLRSEIADDLRRLIMNAEAAIAIVEGDPCISEHSALHTRISLINHIRGKVVEKTELAFTVRTYTDETA